ncbi:MAG: KOW domain-containing RNA-binding protein [Lachnospiraceae bacterium]|nr:KOW domain-containing RNA-binding protein [Lachnospiraceae bacterium]
MKVWTSKMLAVSLAGHDKGSLYVVLEELPGYFLLVDGRRRTLEHPKKKKAKHVQLITHLPDALLPRMEEIALDAHVRKILSRYKEYQKTGEEDIERLRASEVQDTIRQKCNG